MDFEPPMASKTIPMAVIRMVGISAVKVKTRRAAVQRTLAPRW
jgi:hypothetical protein